MSGALVINKDEPRVSVIIPVFNTEKWLSECIESVLTESNSVSLEIILVNDESPDNSQAIIDRYVIRYPFIHGYRQSHGKQGKARNTGLRHAVGEYVFFLDSDDRLYPGALRRFVLEADRQVADMVVGLARSFCGFRKWINAGYRIYDKKRVDVRLDEFPALLEDPSACNKLYRRIFLNRHDLRFPENTFCEDAGFIFKAVTLAKHITILPEILHEYRGRGRWNRHNPSVTQTITAQTVTECAHVYRTCIDFMDPKASDIVIETLHSHACHRFRVFFQRIDRVPPADDPLYPALQELFIQLKEKIFLTETTPYTVPFFMIRHGCLRHAVAMLKSGANRVALQDFLTILKKRNRDAYPMLIHHMALTDNGSLALLGRWTQKDDPLFSIKQLIFRIGFELKGLFQDSLKLFFASMDILRQAFFTFTPNHRLRRRIKDLFFSICFEIGTLGVLLLWRPIAWRLFKRRVWLVGERDGWGAEDNGYAFFRFAVETLKCSHVYFVLNRKRGVPHGFPNKRLLIRKGSLRHLFYIGFTECMLVTNSDRDICPFYVLGRYRRFVLSIFLTHGVTLYSPGGEYLRNGARHFDCIVAISDLEKRQKMRDWEIERESLITVTGLPRFDGLLTCQPKNEILLCLTWRQRLEHLNHNDVLASRYFNTILSLIQSRLMIDFLRKYRMHLVVRTHFRITSVIDQMKIDAPNDVVRIEFSDPKRSLRNAIEDAAVLITDYSSIMWDMAYMGRPVILYPFDVDEFLSERGMQGFSIENDRLAFAQVVTNTPMLMAALTNLANQDFKLNPIQKRDTDGFFAFHDDNNCRRVYDLVMKNLN